MQCPQCRFENMPGLEKCAFCQTPLTAKKAIPIHPPRARWRRPLRAPLYLLRRVNNRFVSVEKQSKLDKGLRELIGVFADCVFMVLSVVPGLGHLLRGKLWSIRYYWIAYVVVLAMGLAAFGTNQGSIALGVAIGLHAWMMLDAGQFRKAFADGPGRFVGFILVMILVGYFGYWSIPRFLVSGIRTAGGMPGEQIAPGDFLLVDKRSDQKKHLRRGDLVIYDIHARTIRYHAVGKGSVLGRVLALPNDVVHIDVETMTVSSVEGEQKRYNLPHGTLALKASFTVPPDAVFCVPGQVTVSMLNMDEADSAIIIELMCQPTISSVHGRAFMVYNTFSDRRPIRRIPLPELSVANKQ